MSIDMSKPTPPKFPSTKPGTKPGLAKAGAAKPGAKPAATASGSTPGLTKSRAIVIAVVLAFAVLVPGSVWAWMHFSHLSRLQKATALLAQARGPNEDLTWQQREDAQKALEAMKLSGTEKQELRNNNNNDGPGAERRREIQAEMDKYTAMTAAERAAYMKKKAEQIANDLDKQAAADKSGSDSNSSRGSGGGAGRGGTGGNQGSNAAENREQRRKQRLDNTTPLQRAQRTIFRQDLAAAIGQQNTTRMAQGLPAIPAPGSPGFRGGFGGGR